MDRKLLGKRIKDERVKNGMTQKELAQCIGVSRAYIGFIEHGERAVTLEKLILLAKCFHVPLGFLFKEEADDSVWQCREERLHDLWNLVSADEKDLILSFTEFVASHKA